MKAKFQRVDEAERPTAEILDRRPPCNLEAEMGVLGSIFLLPDCADEVVMIVRADDFYDEANRKLFEHMVRLHDSGRKVDLTLLSEQLKSDGDYDFIGGAAYLARVLNSVPNAAHAEHYAQIVAAKSINRNLITAATDILRDAYDENDQADRLVSRAEE
ncbi:MAG: DnaB-like helicase N-terminal domain-containing protein, partial [Blastopirellula sp. JB062]